MSSLSREFGVPTQDPGTDVVTVPPGKTNHPSVLFSSSFDLESGDPASQDTDGSITPHHRRTSPEVVRTVEDGGSMSVCRKEDEVTGGIRRDVLEEDVIEIKKINK